MEISVVIPVYGCPEALPELHRRLCDSLSSVTKDFEIILVEDRCPKNSWAGIRELCAADKRVKGIRFSRNFGQTRAITAGVDAAKGNYVVVMDCDLQDPPEAIPRLYAKAKEGYEVVFARRMERKDSAITKFFSRCFYKVYSYFTDTPYDSSTCNFSIAGRKVIDAFCSMREQHRDYSTFLTWLGFTRADVDITAEERFAGESSYSFRKKLKLALEIITSESNKPLLFAVKGGFIVAGLALLFILVLVIRILCGARLDAGWPSMIASIYLMGGLILAAVGIVGIYVGNIFNEAKNRPLYVIEESLNLDEKE